MHLWGIPFLTAIVVPPLSVLTVSTINIIVWNVKPHMEYQMSLRRGAHLFLILINCILISYTCLPIPLLLNAMIFRGLWIVIGIILQQSKHISGYDGNLFFSAAEPESSHNLLHHSQGIEYVIQCITIYILTLHWLTWGLTGILTCNCFQMTIAVFVLMVAADWSCVVYFERNVLPANPGFVACRFLLCWNSWFTWLQRL
jgi:hypothetical protein